MENSSFGNFLYESLVKANTDILTVGPSSCIVTAELEFLYLASMDSSV